MYHRELCVTYALVGSVNMLAVDQARSVFFYIMLFIDEQLNVL